MTKVFVKGTILFLQCVLCRKKLYSTGCLVKKVVLEILVAERAGKGGTKEFAYP